MPVLYWYHVLLVRDLQVLQNNALRLCKQYCLLDRIQIDRLHHECTIIGLEQRQCRQLLRLMYLHSKVEDNITMPKRVTRAFSNIVFKTSTRCTGKYLNSPFYKGTTLVWNNLDLELQRICNVKHFVEGTKQLYRNYQEIW